jgi:hypothetical protein
MALRGNGDGQIRESPPQRCLDRFWIAAVNYLHLLPSPSKIDRGVSVGLLSDLLSRKSIENQARHEAKQFAKRLPRERAGNKKLLAAEFEIAQGHLLGYKRQAKLGVYGTSSLINGFRWGLIDAGYDDLLARDLSRELAMKLAAGK